RGHTRITGGEDDIGRERGQFRRMGAKPVGIARAPAGLDLHVAADGPARLLQALQKRPVARLSERIVGGKVNEHADAPHPLLLRPRREWPSRRRAADERDELTAFHLRGHSITSSAATCSVGGTVRPSALAVLRFITNSNLVGCKTGKSA